MTKPLKVEVVKPIVLTFEEKVRILANKYGQDADLALKIMKCESDMYGNVAHINRDKNGIAWSTDWGYWQINDYYNKPYALELGLNIFNDDDNLEFGFILLKERGTQPWKASKLCWSKS